MPDNYRPTNMQKKSKLRGILAAVATLGATTMVASATAVDMSGLVTGITDQVTESFTTAIPIIAAVLGISIGVRLIKKWAK